MRSYAIGDIHGQLTLLTQAHAWIAADRARVNDPEAPVIHLGDLVDRGPQVRGVIETLLAGQIAGKPWIVLRGNHDTMMAIFPEGRRDPALREGLEYLHPKIGGIPSLESYGIDCADARPLAEIQADARRKIPATHLRFLIESPLYHLRGEVLFVHAGIRPRVALEDQTDTDLTWIRDTFHAYTAPHPWLVIHGHTPITAPKHYGNRVNIDSGAAFGGPLTAIVIEGRDVFTLGPQGRTALLPATD
ncbi:metallophosphoesterase family protein [Pararhodobacter sp.]|uniref:metallophosphoesterase family protein n=1 Tax=Pararhodobacter sp. TaxID=2127056 RepID=UPI002AFE6835|nr:metallophosphoesterase family protein [Pararhodobacter sp.]